MVSSCQAPTLINAWITLDFLCITKLRPHRGLTIAHDRCVGQGHDVAHAHGDTSWIGRHQEGHKTGKHPQLWTVNTSGCFPKVQVQQKEPVTNSNANDVYRKPLRLVMACPKIPPKRIWYWTWNSDGFHIVVHSIFRQTHTMPIQNLQLPGGTLTQHWAHRPQFVLLGISGTAFTTLEASFTRTVTGSATVDTGNPTTQGPTSSWAEGHPVKTCQNTKGSAGHWIIADRRLAHPSHRNQDPPRRRDWNPTFTAVGKDCVLQNNHSFWNTKPGRNDWCQKKGKNRCSK